MISKTRHFWHGLQTAWSFFSYPIIRGEGNQLENVPRNFRTRLKISGNNNTVRFGKNFTTKWLEIEISGNNTEMVIGDNCKVTGTLKVKGTNNSLHIGDNTTVQDAYIIAEENHNVEIGKDCMISSDILIRTTDAHSIIDLETGQRKNPARSIHIGHHVWLGMGCVIAPGAAIANNCIVATRAVVTKIFDKPHCTVGGVPARILSENVDWDRKRL